MKSEFMDHISSKEVSFEFLQSFQCFYNSLKVVDCSFFNKLKFFDNLLRLLNQSPPVAFLFPGLS